MSDIETVKVVHNDGYALINKGDFNDKIHQLYIEKEDEMDEDKKSDIVEEKEEVKVVKEKKVSVPKKKKGSK